MRRKGSKEGTGCEKGFILVGRERKRESDDEEKLEKMVQVCFLSHRVLGMIPNFPFKSS